MLAQVFLDLPDGVSSVFVGTDAGTVMRWSIAGVLTRAAGMVRRSNAGAAFEGAYSSDCSECIFEFTEHY